MSKPVAFCYGCPPTTHPSVGSSQQTFPDAGQKRRFAISQVLHDINVQLKQTEQADSAVEIIGNWIESGLQEE